MNVSDREPMELDQRDYGINYRASGSSSVSLKVEGGMLALAVALVAFGGVVIGAITIPSYASARVEAEVSKTIAPLQARLAQYEEVAWDVERDTRIQEEQIKRIEIGLSKKGININADGH